MLIAEISSNHNQDLSRCLRLIDAAADCGFDAVKFQIFKIEKLFTSEVLKQSQKHSDRKNWELPIEFLPDIKKRCSENNLKLGITPFYIQAVNESIEYLDFFKVASYEVLWKDLHVAIAKKKLPTIISSGMATMPELLDIKKTFIENGLSNFELTFLHCESNYPAFYNSANLSAISSMRAELRTEVGWSDHTRDTDVILMAKYRFGCETFELHFDIDGKGEEAGVGHCWLPKEIKQLNKRVKKFDSMLGHGTKFPSENEILERDWRADPIDGLRPTREIRNNLNL